MLLSEQLIWKILKIAVSITLQPNHLVNILCYTVTVGYGIVSLFYRNSIDFY